MQLLGKSAQMLGCRHTHRHRHRHRHTDTQTHRHTRTDTDTDTDTHTHTQTHRHRHTDTDTDTDTHTHTHTKAGRQACWLSHVWQPLVKRLHLLLVLDGEFAEKEVGVDKVVLEERAFLAGFCQQQRRFRALARVCTATQKKRERKKERGREEDMGTETKRVMWLVGQVKCHKSGAAAEVVVLVEMVVGVLSPDEGDVVWNKGLRKLFHSLELRCRCQRTVVYLPHKAAKPPHVGRPGGTQVARRCVKAQGNTRAKECEEKRRQGKGEEEEKGKRWE